VSAPSASGAAAAPIIVLVAPQDIVNIASAVRLAKNFGITGIRLVNPEVFDPWRIEGIAHNTADLVAKIEICSSLSDALRDTVYSVALTARGRAAKRTVLEPREAAAELVATAATGPVAMVFGREDKGLTNDELDFCRALVSIPTSSEYTSMNLAQAIGVMSYETWRVRIGADIPNKPPRRRAAPAAADQIEWLFTDWTRTLWAIDFFKTRQHDHVMRSFREIIFRAGLDGREASLLRAMGIEVRRFLERKGVAPAALPPTEPAESHAGEP
jgi:TrmH family RNA methyltransferase